MENITQNDDNANPRVGATSDTGVVLQLADGTIAACNAAAQVILGMSIDQLQALSPKHFLWQMIHPDGTSFPSDAHPATVALATGKPFTDVRVGYYQPTGELVWLNLDALPLFRRGETIPYAVTLSITQLPLESKKDYSQAMMPPMTASSLSQRNAASKISDYCSLLQQIDILESITDAFFLLDQSWRFTYINSQAVLLLSSDGSELIGRHIWDVFPDAIGSEFDQAYHRAVNEGVTVNVEAFYPPHQTWYAARAYPNRFGLAVYFQNINERKQTEVILRQQQQLAQKQLGEITAIYATAPVGLCFISTDLRFVRLNNHLAKINGVSVEAHIGRTLREILPEQAVVLEPLYQKVIQTGVPVENFEVHGTNAAQPGVERDWLLSFYPVKAEDGTVLGVNAMVYEITERKQTEAALAQTHSILQAIIEGATDIIFVKDRQGRYVIANPAAANWLNTSVETMLGQDNITLFPPEIVQRIVQSDQQAMRSGEPVVYEEEIPKQGGVRSLLSTKYPWRDAEGNTLGVIGISHDISDFKAAQEALRRSEERYRSLFESIDEGFCIIEVIFDENDKPIDYRFLEINSAFERHTGLAQAQGKTARQLLPDLEDHWFEIYGHVALTGEPYRLENGSDVMNRWFDVFTFRFGQPEERKVAIRFKDISERKRAEDALQESQMYLKSAVEAARLVAFTWDVRTDQFHYWQSEADVTERLGAFIENFEQKLNLVHPDDRAQFQVDIQTALTSGNFESEHRHLLPDGSIIWILDRGQVRFDAAGSPIALSGTAINITDLKTAADERERLLQREQAAREEAERANRIKDEFLAVLSHELRTPLNPILGWTRLLQQGKLDAAKTAEALKTIARNATLQAQLIDDLLDVSRILRGKLTLTAEPVNLATVIEAAIDTVRLAADAKSMTIKTQLDPTVKSVRGDAGRLQQVVWNLLTNAIKFTPSHGRIEIRLTQSGSNTQIQVSDTGKGISPDFLPLVFERFQQVDSSITRQFGGLGLGLAIVRQIVELHGGSITADSPGEGQGATFIVTLPLPQQTLSTTNQAPTAVALSETAPLAGIRALVVDDDPDSRDFVAFVLEQEGATVVQTSAAGKGLQILAESQFDVLVSDIGMPEMDGYTFLRQLRTKPVAAGGQIPAIALTAYVGELDRQQAIAVGFQHHLAKPVNPDQLTQMILSLTRP